LKEEGKKYVVSNTIYKYIYEHEPWLRKHLRYKKWYKKRWWKEKRKIRTNKRDIRDRDNIIEERRRIWDIEIDTVISKGRGCRLFTAFDRTSRLSWIRRLESGRAEEVYKTMVTVFSRENILSITSDNW
jgi:IS30 family transposase